ncbi:MAG: hypothetical protein OEQ53_04910, partial [Saprospiraceae bacterium]|nr:hypothetical protein [Saprospiraceae bacterium]
WVKETCAVGVQKACETGRWLSVATSNFCGPQFVGMWHDVNWHIHLTDLVHNSSVARDLYDTLFAKRLRYVAEKLFG